VAIGALNNRPQSLLRQFRTRTIDHIENSLGPCEDPDKWALPSFPWNARPGLGWGLSSTAALLLLAALCLVVKPDFLEIHPMLAAYAQVIAGALGGLGIGLGAATYIRRSRRRNRWRRELRAAFTKTLEDQFAVARQMIDDVYCATSSLGALMPEIHERRVGIERALFALENIKNQTTELDELFETAAARQGDHGLQTGRHARLLAAALRPDTPLYNFFHENGFDLDASDLFGKICEVEYALKPLLGLQSIQTVRGWLRPPLGKREKSIYGYLDRLRLRWDEVADKSQELARRILRQPVPGRQSSQGLENHHLDIRSWSQPLNGTERPPRIALPEEVLESILARILDEAQKHAYNGRASGERVDLVWSIHRLTTGEVAVLLDVMLHGGHGFDDKGRKDFDLSRGGLASYLSNTDSGALAWCERIVVTSVDQNTVWMRTINGRRASFTEVDQQPPAWTTRFSLIMPVLIEGDRGA
jgi:hypothetical protein